MKKRIRFVARLDIKGGNLVKGIHLEGLRVLGPPEKFASQYYKAGADELVFVDSVASLYGRNSLLDVVESTSRSIFVPLTVAGGLRTMEDIEKVLRSGADKTAINSAAIARPGFISEAAERFGSSTIVVQIDAKRSESSKWLAFTDNGRENSGRDVVKWATEAEKLGAGEILLTSIDQEGTGSGFDIELMKAVADSISIPLIASGGAGQPDDVLTLLENCNVEAVCLASLLHYEIVRDLEKQGFDFGKACDFRVLNERRDFTKVNSVPLGELKKTMNDAGYGSLTA